MPDAGAERELDAEAAAAVALARDRQRRRRRAGRSRAARRRPSRQCAHCGDDRPGRAARGRADDEAEVPGAQRRLVDVGARRGAADRAHGGRRRDLVDLADEGQDRAGDVGERDEPVVDDEAALEHAVVGDELAQEVGQRRARARRPSRWPRGTGAGARAAAAPRGRAAA